MVNDSNSAGIIDKERKNLTYNIFSDISNKYDLMNDIMSFGMHRFWKYKFVSMIPNFNHTIIEVAAGTGDIAFRIHNLAKKLKQKPSITLCDINDNMLDICRNRAIDKNILSDFNIILADGEKLPFEDNSFDYYLIVFGIRNMASVTDALNEAYRVLKPTGKFLCLEFNRVDNEDYISKIYNRYLLNVIPKMGKCIANNEAAYTYLAETIQSFYSQEEFKTLVHNAGFSNINYLSLTFGIASIYYGYKL
ncbi:class I SAM-dependent methyltransferase [Rickettsia endosymbiont of Cardiosporidium cionae]|uniref:class I SAM-dependent methyltransferase n=1 Tax=Rickettsia endosymbiont of Cardiosporidium cionae TaxID=2777155 RepID=UPI0018943B92|nr:class I SAM-dependent methyltransferase [Rickettsia endosymbiont of Cardiosporidium cionae]KAF8818493.1 bifunctional demethylmenaquinone methyltransferase/2-methoxy-6-polyprenyl-1,4-benzoquinol methylase UbiE [Rickettsia endosymbiont of Cardiosporidium cionae]